MKEVVDNDWRNRNGNEFYFLIGIHLVIYDIKMCLCILHAIRLKGKSSAAATLNELAIEDLNKAYTELYSLLVLEGEATPCSTPPDFETEQERVKDELLEIEALEFVPDSLIPDYHLFQMVEASQYLIQLGASALAGNRHDLLHIALRACQFICTEMSRVEVFRGMRAKDQSVSVVKPAWHPQIQLTVNRIHTSSPEIAQRDLEACINSIEPSDDGSIWWKYEEREHFQLPPRSFSQVHH